MKNIMMLDHMHLLGSIPSIYYIANPLKNSEFLIKGGGWLSFYRSSYDEGKSGVSLL